MKPAAECPTHFVRGTTVLDSDKIGFLAPSCVPGEKLASGYCFDTSETGNAAVGHEFGTTLSPDDKNAFIAY